MDLFLICRDALENSLVTSLLMAMEAKREGSDVGVLFTQEALVAVAGQAFDWSPLLRDRPTRTRVAKKAKELGIPTHAAPTPGFPAINTKELMKAAKTAGVSLFACPVWAEFLELQGKLSPEITEIDLTTALKTIREAKTVLGTF